MPTNFREHKPAWDRLVAAGQNYANSCSPYSAVSVPTRYDGDWLRRAVSKFGEELEQKADSDDQAGLGHGTREGLRLRESREELADVSASALQTLAGPLLSEAAVNFIVACIRNMTAIPVTATRDGELRSWVKEGNGSIVGRNNLSPEWLRHFMGVLYDEGQYKRLSGCEYYPFANRDHLIHSFFVFAFGHVVLGILVDEDATTRVCEAIRNRSDASFDRESIMACTTVGELAQAVLAARGLVPSDSFSFASTDTQWTSLAWSLIAFWHDAGYDFAAWYLLTTREFAHTSSIGRLLGQALGEAKWVLRRLCRRLEGDLPSSFESLLRGAFGVVREPYHLMWHVEQWWADKPDAPWGRWHALFSAHEFFERLKLRNEQEKPWWRILGAAIAEHHEPEPKELGDGELAARFVRNPLGAILRFVDALGGIQRVNLRWPTANEITSFNSAGDPVTFSVDLDEDPLWMSPDPDRGTRWLFYRSKSDAVPANTARSSLWGRIRKE